MQDALTALRAGWPLASAVPVLDIVIPVHDEEADLAASIERLHRHLDSTFPYSYRITIADNASTDDTPVIADRLAERFDEVESLRIEQKGRGRALAAAWTASDAQVLAYMDVDLSTDLDALLPLVAPLISGHSHLAIGTRLDPDAQVVRGPKREFISRSYNLILKGVMAAGFSDAQCGFKALRADVARELLPHVRDTGWFFDTELLVLAERAGLRVHEVPVDWVDDPNSSVDIVATAKADLAGLARLARSLARREIPLEQIRINLTITHADRPSFLGQVGRFAAVGVVSTIAYMLLFVVLRSQLSPQWSNLIALAVTAVFNTAANRRFTFGVRGGERFWTHHAQGLVVFGVALAITSGSLALLRQVAPAASQLTELAVVVAANVTATVVRFLGLRVWVFASHRSFPPAPNPSRLADPTGDLR